MPKARERTELVLPASASWRATVRQRQARVRRSPKWRVSPLFPGGAIECCDVVVIPSHGVSLPIRKGVTSKLRCPRSWSASGKSCCGYFQVALSCEVISWASQVISALLCVPCRGVTSRLRCPRSSRFSSYVRCYFQVALSQVITFLLRTVIALAIGRYFQVALSQVIVALLSLLKLATSR
jgi:hypothetical protein